MAYHPSLTIPDLYNAPAGGRRPSFRNRKIDVAYRLLGVEETISLYHTGEREPPIHLPPQVSATGGSSKIAEEVMRWDLQNSAAELRLKRFVVDDWEHLEDAFVAPFQIVTFPPETFPPGWPAEHRQFVVREVNEDHQVDAGVGHVPDEAETVHGPAADAVDGGDHQGVAGLQPGSEGPQRLAVAWRRS